MPNTYSPQELVIAQCNKQCHRRQTMTYGLATIHVLQSYRRHIVHKARPNGWWKKKEIKCSLYFASWAVGGKERKRGIALRAAPTKVIIYSDLTLIRKRYHHL